MPMLNWLIEQYTELVAAVRFLSTIPMPGATRLFETQQAKQETPRLILGSAYFPLVGLLIALILGLLLTLANLIFPHLVVAALLTIALVILTGGLHLDGLMDTCDGVFGGRTRERRLEIMRDSRVGSFGVLGGACVLLLTFALFASMNTHMLIIAFLTVLPCSRWAMVLALRVFPSARSTGLGVTFRQTVTPVRLIVAGSIALIAALIAGHFFGLIVWLITTCVSLVMGAWFMDRLGGLTGDSYGAIAEMSEVIGMLVLLSFLIQY